MSREATQFKSGRQAVENGRKGGSASGASRRRKKRLSEILDILLQKKNEDGQSNLVTICAAIIEKAAQGNIQAFREIRDTVEGRPTLRGEVSIETTKTERLTPEEICRQLIEQQEAEIAAEAKMSV